MKIHVKPEGYCEEDIYYVKFDLDDMEIIVDHYGHSTGFVCMTGKAKIFPSNIIDLEIEDSHVFIYGNNGEELTDYEDWDYCKNEKIIAEIKEFILLEVGEY